MGRPIRGVKIYSKKCRGIGGVLGSKGVGQGGHFLSKAAKLSRFSCDFVLFWSFLGGWFLSRRSMVKAVRALPKETQIPLEFPQVLALA
jgi:hypothetical protein